MKKLKSKKGFTIAELTIAMMLVAGIAMILMPTLVADNEKQVFATSLNKIYTQLQQTNQAIGLLKAQGKIQPGISAINMYKEAISLSMKTVANKKEQYLEGYYPKLPAYSKMDFSTEKNTNSDDIIILKNGVFIYFDAENNLIVDVNGRKQPNTTGQDIFYFTITESLDGSTQITPKGDDASCPSKKENKDFCSSQPSSCDGCAFRILQGDGNGKIDYF